MRTPWWLLLLSLAACGDEDPDDTAATDDTAADDTGEDTDVEGLEIEGTWSGDFGDTHEITSETWTMSFPDTQASVFHHVEYSSAERWLVSQNDDANAWSAGLYSRFDWTWDDDGELWFCQSAFDAASADDAKATAAADDSDPASSGCGGYAWSHLSVPE